MLKQPRIQDIGAGGQATSGGLAAPLWLPPAAAGNLCRKRPLHGHLLPGGQLAPCRTDPGAGQARPIRQAERPHQGRMAVSLGKKLQKWADPVIFGYGLAEYLPYTGIRQIQPSMPIHRQHKRPMPRPCHRPH